MRAHFDPSVITNVIVEIRDDQGRDYAGPLVLNCSAAHRLFRTATRYYQLIEEQNLTISVNLYGQIVTGRAIGFWQTTPKPT
jgi:hypothetical protein